MIKMRVESTFEPTFRNVYTSKLQNDFINLNENLVLPMRIHGSGLYTLWAYLHSLDVANPAVLSILR